MKTRKIRRKIQKKRRDRKGVTIVVPCRGGLDVDSYPVVGHVRLCFTLNSKIGRVGTKTRGVTGVVIVDLFGHVFTRHGLDPDTFYRFGHESLRSLIGVRKTRKIQREISPKRREKIRGVTDGLSGGVLS